MNLADYCAACKAKTEQSKLTYLEELERLQGEVEQLQKPQQSEAITKLLDIVQIDIERQEKAINHDPHILAAIEAFRAVRPR